MSTAELPTAQRTAPIPFNPSLAASQGRPGRQPTKRELRIWRAVRIDQQSPLDVAIEFGYGIIHVNRLVRWIDALRARENVKAWDAKSAYENLYREAARAFRISQRTETRKSVRKTKGELPNGQTEKIDSSIKSRNAGNPAFIKLCVDLADRLTSFGVDRPSRESARMANESERQNIEAIDALRRSGAIGSVTRTERIEFVPAPSAGRSTPELSLPIATMPTGVGVRVLVDGGAQTPAATTHAPPHFSPADFGPQESTAVPLLSTQQLPESQVPSSDT